MKEYVKKFLIFLFILYEEIFLYPAKNLLKLLSKYVNYEKFILKISQNFFYSLVFIVFLAVIAESSAILAGILVLKGIWPGALLYFVKVAAFVPLVDLFKHNKEKLLKIKQIRTIYFYYLVLQRHYLIRSIRRKIKLLKLSIKETIKESKSRFVNLFKNNLFKF